MRRVVVRLLGDTTLVAILLFASAETLAWWRAWLLLAVMLLVRAFGARAVVDSGLYAVVRHPFYAADPLILVGMGLWLESYVAVLCAVIPISLMVMRLRFEERFLRRELPGYDEYTLRVPHRLIPWVW